MGASEDKAFWWTQLPVQQPPESVALGLVIALVLSIELTAVPLPYGLCAGRYSNVPLGLALYPAIHLAIVWLQS
jgi:hypothetical protein